MPIITWTLPEGYEAISRPVARGMIDSIIRHVGLEGKVTVQFNGEDDMAPQAGSTLGAQNRDSGTDPRMGNTQKVTATLRETFIDREILTATTWEKNNAEIFIDDALDITIKPVYHQVDGVISISYRAQDRVSAEQWINRLVRHISQNRNEMYHEIEYEVGIPRVFLAILRELHRLRENQAGYGESLGDYLARRFTDRTTVGAKMNGEEPDMLVREAQKGVIGWFDWEVPPEPERGENAGTWLATFEYHYQYDQATGMAMKYPIMVHQQMLDEKWRGRNTPYEMEPRPAYMSMAKSYYEANRGYKGGFLETMDGIVFPDYDEWQPKRIPKGTRKLMSVLLQVDPNDPTLILNINDLEHWNLDPAVKAYLLATRRFATATHFSPVVLSLYSGGNAIDEQAVYLDENGDFRTRTPMDMRNQYHFVLLVMTDLTMLSRDQEDTFREYPAACLTILKSLDARLEPMGKLPKVIGGRVVSRKGYMEALAFIRTSNPRFQFAPIIGRYTVGTYGIAVTNKERSHANRRY